MTFPNGKAVGGWPMKVTEGVMQAIHVGRMLEFFGQVTHGNYYLLFVLSSLILKNCGMPRE